MRKKGQHILICAVLAAVCAALTICAAALRVGDTVDYVLATDIRAFIDGHEIAAYNVSGHLGVVAEDLANYGFRVSWSQTDRTLTLTRDKTREVVGTENEIPTNSYPLGKRLMPVLYTDIVTYLDGRAVASYNIDGRTIVYFSELDGYGDRVYDDGARLSMISFEGKIPAAVTITSLPRKIIHAGGEVGGHIGSNSLEALELSYGKGYRFMELDFRLSSDGHPVCLHDWSNYYSASLGSTPVSQAEFAKVKIFNLYTSMDLDSLAEWLSAHPDAYIITDVKDDNVKILEQIAAEHHEIMPQIIPQIYARDEYAPVRALGYSNIVFTVYRLENYSEKANASSLAEFASKNSLLAITADVTLASKKYVSAFTGANVPLFVHTVNGTDAQQNCYSLGISCVYTDYSE